MIQSRSVFEMDLYILAATISLVVVGVLFIFSSGVTATGQIVSREYIRQIAWAITGLVLMFVVTFLDYRLFNRLSIILFGTLISLLIVTALFGRVVNGARSWLGVGSLGGQPSEFAKIGLIIMLARYYSERDRGASPLLGFLGGLGLALIPTALVLSQPDLGTALVYLPIFLVMAFVAGIDERYIGFIVGVGVLTGIFTVLPVWQSHLADRHIPFIAVLTSGDTMVFLLSGLGAAFLVAGVGLWITHRRLFFWIMYGLGIVFLSVPMAYAARTVLQDYQIMRLIVFIDPYVDPRGAGWNIIQSVTAVGSGGPFGKGFLEGTQSHYQYLPQQSTDFIFSILAEEWGFVGVLVVFVLFGVIFGRGIYIMATARDRFAALIAAGVVGMLFFHFVVNVGMAVGIMPITGIPLFLLSYGGSSLWTAMVGIGLIMSVYQHRYQY